MKTRICRVCGLEKPYDEMSKHPQCKDGINSICRICASNRARQWDMEHPEEAAERKLKWERDHPDKVAQANRKWRQANPEKDRQGRRLYQIKNAAKYRAYAYKYYHLNPEKYRERSRNWMTRHPEQMRQRNRIRRMRQFNLPDQFTEQDWLKCLEYWNYSCAYCDQQRSFWQILARDHFIPVTDPRIDNPGTVSWNILPACHGIDGCNNSKRHHDPIEWLTSKFGVRKAKQILKRIDKYFAYIRIHKHD